MVKAVLLVEIVNHTLLDRLDEYDRSVEVGLLICFPDNPVNKCAEKIALTELNHFLGVGLGLRGRSAV